MTVRPTPLSGASTSSPTSQPITGADHLTPETLALAQRHLVTKAISELSHERLLSPEPDGPGESGRWLLASPEGREVHRFAARRLPLEHWAVDPATVERTVDGEPAPLDAQAFVVAHSPLLGIPDELLPTYLEEIAATLAAATWKLTRPEHLDPPAAVLADAGHQRLEAAMSEGHPGFIANNGRVGFGLHDYEAYAPEAAAATRLVWVAARRERTHLSLGEGLTESGLYDAELDADLRARFDERLRARGLDPAAYLLLPLHPWQWHHKVAITFAPDLAREDLVLLGEGPDAYQSQQSIRTFYNLDHPERAYVKTALAVQNMGFLRGLSPAWMVPTPAINDHVARIVEGDATLAGCGFSVLRERAAIGYTGDAFHVLQAERGVGSPHQKMIAALWRESPVPRLAEDERAATMAALLHRDRSGRSLVGALVDASGLSPAQWLRRYVDAYLRPLVHCLLAHDLAFMPHGENVILVLRDHVPVRALMKDIGEEVAIMNGEPLPPEIARIAIPVDHELRALALQTDVFDGVLRHLAAILDTDGLLSAEQFWAEVGACIARHHEEHPELADAASAYDLFGPSFKHSCLNRLQLRNTVQMVDLTDMTGSLQYAGVLDNPIAGMRRGS